MGGLMFFAVIGLWGYFLKRLVNAFDSRMPKPPWRQVVKVLLFAVLFPLPLIDEIVGGRQFAKLCEANVVRIDKEAARGRTVYKERSKGQISIAGTWIKVWQSPFRYVDALTGDLVASFDQLHAEGGHLFPGFDSGPDPLTFKGECNQFSAFDAISKEIGLKEIPRPQGK